VAGEESQFISGNVIPVSILSCHPEGGGNYGYAGTQKNLLHWISANFGNTRLELLHNIIKKGEISGKDFITHNSE
jgi:hypothetical protein